MKQVFVVLAAILGLSSQCAFASEPSPLYVGVGLAAISNGGTPVSTQEQQFLMPGGPYQAGRSEKSSGIGGDLFVGYKLTKNLAVEAGYIGGGSGLGSLTSGSANFTDFWGNKARDPFTVTQDKKVTAWYLSAVGEKSLSASSAASARCSRALAGSRASSLDARLAHQAPAVSQTISIRAGPRPRRRRLCCSGPVSKWR